MDTSPLLRDLFATLHRMTGGASRLLDADLDRIRDATGRLDAALWRAGQAKWSKADADEQRRCAGDLQVAQGRLLEALASAEKHGAEAVVSALVSVVRALLDRRLP